MKHLLRKKGFTIIEVSLVLAIAGVILTMAFIALPALQRQSRDAQRKTDASKFITALKEYQRNNRGALPKLGTAGEDSVYFGDSCERNSATCLGSWALFYSDYLGGDFLSPDGERYAFAIRDCYTNEGESSCHESFKTTPNNFSAREYDWSIFIGATCENGTAIKSNNKRNIAVVGILETNDTYCINN